MFSRTLLKVKRIQEVLSTALKLIKYYTPRIYIFPQKCAKYLRSHVTSIGKDSPNLGHCESTTVFLPLWFIKAHPSVAKFIDIKITFFVSWRSGSVGTVGRREISGSNNVGMFRNFSIFGGGRFFSFRLFLPDWNWIFILSIWFNSLTGLVRYCSGWRVVSVKTIFTIQSIYSTEFKFVILWPFFENFYLKRNQF